jgi:hypothetical protein
MTMSKPRLLISALLLGILMISTIGSPAALAKGRPLKADLAGANEVPGPGDPDGTGRARLRLNQGKERVCYRIEVSAIDAATAAHIHRGPAGVAGPVVVTLGTPDASGIAEGCVTVDRELVKTIRKNASGYYVNVHNSVYPDGAVRGQLTKKAAVN